VVPDAAVEPPVASTAAAISQSVPRRDDVTPEFTKELELTVHWGDDPVQDAPLLVVREVVPEGQTPSPSLVAFNKSFGTSHRGELLFVGFEAASIGSGASKILTLWKLPTLVDDAGEGSEQTGGVARESGKGPHSALRRTSVSQGKTSSSSGKKVTMQNLSKQGSFLFVNFCIFQICEFFAQKFSHRIFQNSRTFFVHILRPSWRGFKKITPSNLPCSGKLPLNGLLIKRRQTSNFPKNPRNLSATLLLLNPRTLTSKRR
jgi:hypothetical protein